MQELENRIKELEKTIMELRNKYNFLIELQKTRNLQFKIYIITVFCINLFIFLFC